MSKVKQKRCYGLIPRKPRYWEKWKTTVVGQAWRGFGKLHHQTDKLDQVSKKREEGLVAPRRMLVAKSKGKWTLAK
jgi:hypothetical protein